MLPDMDDHTDHRQWTQQHLDAADLRISSMAPTPPQGEIDADCMDVNVRGPGREETHPLCLDFAPSPTLDPFCTGPLALGSTESDLQTKLKIIAMWAIEMGGFSLLAPSRTVL